MEEEPEKIEEELEEMEEEQEEMEEEPGEWRMIQTGKNLKREQMMI